MLTDFEENALRRFRMKESDLCAACTDARLLVDHADALRHEISDCVLDVVDTQRNVLDALAVLLDVFRDPPYR